jgi:hypothetical protein
MADALEIPPPEGRGRERSDRPRTEGWSAWRALSKRAWRPQAGRPSRGGSVLLPEGGAGRAPTDREEVGDLEVGDLASGSVSYPERGRRPRSWLGLLPRGIAHKAIPTKGRGKRPNHGTLAFLARVPLRGGLEAPSRKAPSSGRLEDGPPRGREAPPQSGAERSAALKGCLPYA